MMSEKKSNRNMTIGVEADTTKLTKKLRAIAKHAEALADELEAIDDAQCEKCGSDNVDIENCYANGELYAVHYFCHDCGKRW